ncbi:MAG TPA: F0F1 ATP synthase subunit B [Patescibacteria group bacterium]|nr:F0F1 ATP synthase subunit B [Patescibacteria group bacterium]
MEFIHALGLDVKLLIANIINFVILMYILKKIAYKPLLQFVHERTKKIEEGVKNAELATQQLAEASSEKEQVLTEARKEAQAIIEQAKKQASEQAQSIIDASHTESERVITAAKEQIAVERTEALKDAKKQVANLTILATKKLLQEEIDEAKSKAFIERTLAEINK